MPVVRFDALPDDARAWVFGAAAPVTGSAAQSLLSTVDAHLANWRAHGAPLVCAREWRADRWAGAGRLVGQRRLLQHMAKRHSDGHGVG